MLDHTSMINTYTDFVGFNFESNQFSNENFHKLANAGQVGYDFTVGNESGTVVRKVPIVVLPAWPKTMSDGVFTCVDDPN